MKNILIHKLSWKTSILIIAVSTLVIAACAQDYVQCQRVVNSVLVFMNENQNKCENGQYRGDVAIFKARQHELVQAYAKTNYFNESEAGAVFGTYFAIHTSSPYLICNANMILMETIAERI